MDPNPLFALTEERPGFLCFAGARVCLGDLDASFWGFPQAITALAGPRFTASMMEQGGVAAGAHFARALLERSPQIDREQGFRECLAAYQTAGFGRFDLDVLEWPIGRALIRGYDTVQGWLLPRHGVRPSAPACGYVAGVLLGFANVLAGREDIVCIEHHCQAQGDEACLFELLPASRAGGETAVRFTPDLSLMQRYRMLDMLFERIPISIGIYDRHLVLQHYNPTFADYVARYTGFPADQVAPGISLQALAGEAAPAVVAQFERALAGETVSLAAFELQIEGILSYWDTVLRPLLEGDRVVGVVQMVSDATERVLAQRELETRVLERTQELEGRSRVAESMRENMQVLNSNRPLNEVLEHIVAQTAGLLGTSACAIYRLHEDGKVLTIQASCGLPDDYVRELVIPVGLGAVGMAVADREPVAIPDTLPVFTPQNDLMRDPKRAAILLPMLSEHRALLAVPLTVKGGMYGGILFYYAQPHAFSDEEIALAVSFADQAALAIENARLQRQVEEAAVVAERSRLARELHDSVTQTIFSASLIADALPRLVERDAAEARRRMEELCVLTRGALAELRTLLVELRPAILENADLGELLRQLAAAMSTHTRMPVDVKVEEPWRLPADVQVALYRIAQEALNNMARHAGASRATLSLRRIVLPGAQGVEGAGSSPGESVAQPEDGVELCVSDDGRGFDTVRRLAGHLGLDSMRERARAIGARVNIESRAGRGTRVTVTWARSGGERT